MPGLRIVLTKSTKDTRSPVLQYVCVPYTHVYRCIPSPMKAFVETKGQRQTCFLTESIAPQLSGTGWPPGLNDPHFQPSTWRYKNSAHVGSRIRTQVSVLSTGH